jgi:hypothetical protein
LSAEIELRENPLKDSRILVKGVDECLFALIFYILYPILVHLVKHVFTKLCRVTASFTQIGVEKAALYLGM